MVVTTTIIVIVITIVIIIIMMRHDAFITRCCTLPCRSLPCACSASEVIRLPPATKADAVYSASWGRVIPENVAIVENTVEWGFDAGPGTTTGSAAAGAGGGAGAAAAPAAAAGSLAYLRETGRSVRLLCMHASTEAAELGVLWPPKAVVTINGRQLQLPRVADHATTGCNTPLAGPMLDITTECR